MTTITDTTNTRPPAAYMLDVKDSARERKRTLYVYRSTKSGDGWVSTINLSMVPFDVQVWSVSPTGFVATFHS